MKSHINFLVYFAVLAAVLILGVQSAPGGMPGKPKPYPQEYRDANMLMLHFQNALAAKKWAEALGLCSDRVRAKANEWSEPADFFRQTIPIEVVLAQSFGCWSCSTQAYGLVVNLTAPNETPVIQWFWAIVATNGSWVVDYPPVKLDEYVIKKKAALNERDEEIARIRRELEPKIKSLKIKLTAASGRFVIGSPMLFKVELFNSGKETVEYQDGGVRFHPLKVLNEQKEPVAYHEQPAQIPVNAQKIAPDSSAVLAAGIDLAEWYSITKPGRYFVEFDGSDLEIGKQMQIPISGPGLFGENETAWWPHDFISSTTKLRSNTVEIEIVSSETK